MGVKTITKTVVTCDKCGDECDKNDSLIIYELDSGFRDVGPSTIEGRITYNQPYGVNNGLLCKKCLKRYLLDFIKYRLGGIDQTPNNQE